MVTVEQWYKRHVQEQNHVNISTPYLKKKGCKYYPVVSLRYRCNVVFSRNCMIRANIEQHKNLIENDKALSISGSVTLVRRILKNIRINLKNK